MGVWLKLINYGKLFQFVTVILNIRVIYFMYTSKTSWEPYMKYNALSILAIWYFLLINLVYFIKKYNFI